MEPKSADNADLVRSVFDEALDLPVDERHPFVEQRLSDRPVLRAEVEHLLTGAEAAEDVQPVFGFDCFDELPDEPPEPALVVGQTVETPLGLAVVERVLSARQRSQVYQARLASPERRVVLKLLLTSSLDRQSMRRFRAEAKMLAMLEHPGIIRLLNAGSVRTPNDDSLPCLITEFVDGQELGVWAARTRPSPKRIASMISQIAMAVHHAHLRGVIHRDLKPSNVIVDGEGRPHVLDLGVARFLEGPSLPVQSTLATQDRAVVGTPSYMAPEQLSATGRVIDLQCDVYALGVMLYELIEGRLPIDVDGLTQEEVLIRKQETRFNAPRLPRSEKEIGEVAALALAADRAVRYPSCEMLARDLERAVAGRPLIHRPPGRWKRIRLWIRREPWLAAAASIAVLATISGTAATAWQAAEASRERDRAIAMFDATRDFARWVVFELDHDLRRLPGNVPVRRQLIANAAETLDELRLDDSAPRELLLNVAEARLQLADILFWQLGEKQDAALQSDEASRLLDLYDDEDEPLAILLRAGTLVDIFRSALRDDAELTLEFYLRERTRVEPLIGRATEVLPNDARGWMWLAECRMRLSRNVYDANHDVDAMFHWIEGAKQAIDRAVMLSPNDSDVRYVAAICYFYDAHAHYDARDDAVYDALEEALRRAEALTATGDTRGPLREAAVRAMESRAMAQDQDYAQAYELMRKVIAQCDRSVIPGVPDLPPFRMAEVSRAWAVDIYLTATEHGLMLGSPEEPLELIDEAITMHQERRARGWTNKAEGDYLEGYTGLREEMRQLLPEEDLAEDQSMPP